MDYSSSSANRSSTASEALSLRPSAMRVVPATPSGSDIFAEHLARVAEDRSRADEAPGRQKDRSPARARQDEADDRRADQASRTQDTDRTEKTDQPEETSTDPQEAASATDESQPADTGTDAGTGSDTDGNNGKTADADKAEASSADDDKKQDGEDDAATVQAAAVETQVKLEKTAKTKDDTGEKVTTADDGKTAAPLTPEEKKAARQAAGKTASAETAPPESGKAADATSSAAQDKKAAGEKTGEPATDQALATGTAETDATAAEGDGGDELAITSKDKKGLGHEAAAKLAETRNDTAKTQPTANAAAPGQAGYQSAKETSAANKASPAANAAAPAQAAASRDGGSGNDLLTGVQATGARSTGTSPTVRIGTLPGQTQPTQLPASTIAIQMARNLQKGVDRFEIRLDPPEMGRIDVKMEVNKDGHVSAHLMADKQDTLDLLQRDQRALQQALQNAGLDADNSSLSFSLRDETPNGGSAFADNGGSGIAGGTDTAADAEEIAPTPLYNVNIAANGGVDIRI